MDGIDKLYTFQKQAGKTGTSSILNFLRDRYIKTVDKLLPKEKLKISTPGKNRIGLTHVGGDVVLETAKLNGGKLALDASLATAAGLATKEGYDLVVGDNAPNNQADTDKAKTETTATTTTTDDKGAASTTTTTTTDDKGTDDGDKGTDVPNKSIYDSAVNWIKENPWLAAAIGAGSLGLGYYAFSDDEDEEEEEE